MYNKKVQYVLNAKQPRNHTCHWPGCNLQVKPTMWGCRRHWFSLPKHLRDKIWEAYEPGQEKTMNISKKYIEASNEVQTWIKDFLKGLK